MEGTADLHIHSTHSDGSSTVEELLHRAQKAGLTTISITDHDTTNALEEARSLALGTGIEVVSGVELSTSHGDAEVHILGYFFDHQSPGLQSYLAHCRTARLRRAERMVEKLNGLNIPLRLESVLEQAGTGSIGRPHIANALVEEGLTENYYEAFSRYIGNGKPAYESKDQVTSAEAVDLLAEAGGLSFVAHPGTMIDERLLKELIQAGIDGVEVVHPSHSPDLVKYYRGIVHEYFLLESGGSDYHGIKKGGVDAFGKFRISQECIDIMRRRLQ